MATPLLSGLAASMKHLAERQRVIAENIANSETPGFKAREVEAPDFAALLGVSEGAASVARPAVRITSAMAALGAVAPAGGQLILDTDVTETKPDGNNVTLEDQLLKMGQLQADFAAATNLYRKQIGLLKAAIGKGGG